MKAVRYANRRKSNEYQELLRIISSSEPSGALVLGGVGMGKTSLVDAVLTTSGVDQPVMSLYCSPTLQDVPFGVLSPYLQALEHMDEPVQILREINSFLAQSSGAEKPRVVVVEDAQYLDPQSCFVLSMLMENAALKLVALGAGTLDPTSALGTLAQSTLLTTIVVQPLGVEGVRAIAESMLGGHLSDGAAATIHRMSGGNPSITEAYVASCLEQGLLLDDQSLNHGASLPNGLWVLAGQMPQNDPRLTDLVSEIHRLSAKEEQRTLELLSLGGAIPVRLLEQSRFEFRRMLDAGQLFIDPHGNLTLTSILHQRVLRQIVPLQQSMELFEEWKELLEDHGERPSAANLRWFMELGVVRSSEEVLSAARNAADREDFTLAWELCNQAKLSQHSGEGAILEAEVLIGLRRFNAARSQLLRFIGKLQEPQLITAAFSQLLIVMTNLGSDSSLLRDYSQQWDERTQNLPHDGQLREAQEANDLARKLLNLWMQVNIVDVRRPAYSEFDSLIDNSAIPVQGQAIALMMLCDIHSVDGNFQTALKLAEEGMNLVAAESRIHSLYTCKFLFRRGWNLLQLGMEAELQELLANYSYGGPRHIADSQNVITILSATADLLQGRIQLAIRKFAEAVTELRIDDPVQLLAFASHMSTYAWKLSDLLPGRQQLETKSLIPGTYSTYLTELLGQAPSQQQLMARAAAAMVGAPLGNERLTEYPAFERMALESVVSQQWDEDLQTSTAQHRLAELCITQQGTRVHLLAALCRLRSEENPIALENLAREALERGEALIGVESLARAAVRHSLDGEPRTCGMLLRQCARVVEEQRINPNKYIARALALTELTAREAEIVQLALAGKNNSQIARLLTVSQRTVEGHLYRVFSKLGISERSQLAVAELDFGESQ